MDLNTLIIILVASLIATSLMTAFSYILSHQFNTLFKEPVLLGYILKNIRLDFGTTALIKFGWILHYIIGLTFVIIYHFLWDYDYVAYSYSAAFLLGLGSGIVGIAGWYIIFQITSHKPKIPFKAYYLQLLIAHIIFGITAFRAHSFLSSYL